MDAAEAEKRKRDAQLGLANNAFGATAGVLATTQATAAARKLHQGGAKAMNARLDEAGTKIGMRNRVAHKVLGSKFLRDPKYAKYAIPAFGAGMVGMQAVNGLMDAQSGVYFANELKRDKERRKREAVVKSSTGLSDAYEGPSRGDGVGVNLSKAVSYTPDKYAELNADRKKRAGNAVERAKEKVASNRNEIEGAAATGVAAGYTGRKVKRLSENTGDLLRGAKQGDTNWPKTNPASQQANPLSQIRRNVGHMTARIPPSPSKPLSAAGKDVVEGVKHMPEAHQILALKQRAKLQGKVGAGLLATGALGAGTVALSRMNRREK